MSVVGLRFSLEARTPWNLPMREVSGRSVEVKVHRFMTTPTSRYDEKTENKYCNATKYCTVVVVEPNASQLFILRGAASTCTPELKAPQ